MSQPVSCAIVHPSVLSILSAGFVELHEVDQEPDLTQKAAGPTQCRQENSGKDHNPARDTCLRYL